MPEDLGLIFNAVIVDKKEKNKNIYNRMHPAQRNNFTIINEDTREPPTSSLKRATNSQIKTNPQLVQ